MLGKCLWLCGPSMPLYLLWGLLLPMLHVTYEEAFALGLLCCHAVSVLCHQILSHVYSPSALFRFPFPFLTPVLEGRSTLSHSPIEIHLQ